LDNSNALENILKKDRFIAISALLVLCILAWLYIIYLNRQMLHMDMDAIFFAMPMSSSWTVVDFILLFLMWFVMMIAMMTASVAPLILIFVMVNRKKKQEQNPFVPTGYLICGYFLIWGCFSLLATLLQWLLQKLSLLNTEMVTTNKILGGIVLIAAGLYQFSSLKRRCLNYCLNPINFIHNNWKEGKRGAFQMGIENGVYCLVCCWVLMILLFISGIMNLLWIALIALFVLIEKNFPNAKWISYIAGVALTVYGTIVLFKSYL